MCSKMSELNLGTERPQYNPTNGQFLKGHVPHNKGKKWSEWMDGRKRAKVLRIGMKNLRGNPNIGGVNRKPVIAIDKEGNHFYFDSSMDAQRKISILAENIRKCCRGERKSAGGYRWFWFNSNEWLNYVRK